MDQSHLRQLRRCSFTIGVTAQDDGSKMTERDHSPKRVRIVSAFNPLQDADDRQEARDDWTSPPQRPPRSTSRDGAPKDEVVAEPPAEANASRFRFKSKHSKSRRRSSRQRDEDDRDRDRDRDHDHRRRERSRSPSSRHRRHRHHHSSHHHRHKRRRTRSASPREAEPVDPHEPPPLDPETAFRESLFDAMADDEGALYWEGVYGQPIHVYERDKVNEQGELESMTDEEYAAYVRQKMWEKTHAGLIEERARRAREREAREKKAEEDRRIHAEMERSLKRGQERRQRRVWQERWSDYLKGWTDWDGTAAKVPWPVQSSDRRDIDEKEVRSFFVRGLDLEELGETQFAARLKDERVRWHPDKIQQKLGGQTDEALIRDVTAIFQIIDKLWADTRPKTT